MTKALQVEPDIGLKEILEISQSDRYSVQYSPFLLGPGGQLGGTIIRSSSPLKGKTKRDGESRQEYLQRLRDSGMGDIADGLQNAIEMAEQQSGTQGVALVEQEGKLKIMSQSAANLAVEGQKGASIQGTYTSYNEALDDYAAAGERAHRPTIA